MVKVPKPKGKIDKRTPAPVARKRVLKPLKAKVIARAQSKIAKMLPEELSALVLDRLYGVIVSRKTADPALSHSARLLSRGRAKVAQKFGEEAVEAVIEGVSGQKAALIAESADVLYHLLLMWVACDIAPDEVWAELVRREGVSGIIEKASRPLPKDVATRKIP